MWTPGDTSEEVITWNKEEKEWEPAEKITLWSDGAFFKQQLRVGKRNGREGKTVFGGKESRV